MGLRGLPRGLGSALDDRIVDGLMLLHQLPPGVGIDCHLPEAAPDMFVQQAQDAGQKVSVQGIVCRLGNRQMKSDIGSDLRTSVCA